jgi:ABC-type multidrug transport system fused ATPase/permease subunit
VFLPTAFVYKLFKNKIASFGKNMHQVAIQSNNFIKNLIRGYADIYLMHRQEYFINKVLKSQQSYNRINQKIQTIQQAFPKMIEWIAIASVFMIFLFFIWEGNNYTEMALTITVYFTSAYRIMPSINRINASLLTMKQHEHLIDIYKNIHHQQKNEHKVNTLSSNNSISFKNKIELKNISLSYSETKDKWVLKDISLTIKKGEMIGLIGESGGGKTTLMYILAALIKPDKGTMMVDDTLIDDSNKFLWNNHVAIVYQEPYIMDGNWIDNIIFGGLEIKEDKIWECLKMVQLYDYVKQLPKQLYENIGDSGSFLSGGQKQRLALARSLYRNAQVLFLDEATSALDEETQKDIMQTIDTIRQSQNITVIMIAHRYSSLQHCDKIYFLNKGIIEKEITYKELMSK